MRDKLLPAVMIDCETVGLAPSAGIWQIGAKCGDHNFKGTLNPRGYFPDDHLFLVDQSTIEWQMSNNWENWNKAHMVTEAIKPAHLISDFIAWIDQLPETPKSFWSRRPIDFFWLNYAAQQFNIPVPWKYYNCYDLMSAATMVPGFTVAKPTSDKAHDAYEDAAVQYSELERLIGVVYE